MPGMAGAGEARRGAEASGLRLVGHSDLDGFGDASQLVRHGDYLFVGHMLTRGTTVLDVRDPTRPRVARQLPPPTSATHSHKVQIAGDLLVVNHEQNRRGHGGAPAPSAIDAEHSAGFQLYDISNPLEPRPVGFFETGGRGVHRTWFVDGRTVFVSARPDGYRERIFIIVDVSDPVRPREVGRWWLPGVWEAGGEELPAGWPAELRYGMHHGLVHGDRAYIGCLDAGIAILDIADPARPTTVARLEWSHDESRDSHTVLPLPDRGLLVVSEEEVVEDGSGVPHQVRVLDVSDERSPREIGRFPRPVGDYPTRGLRFGPHNLHENRPGSLMSDREIYVTYFNAGLRIYDLADPTNPREVAHYVPETPPGQKAIQINDVFVDADGLIYISDRAGGGVYILERTQTS
jgi:hypothetical protein